MFTLSACRHGVNYRCPKVRWQVEVACKPHSLLSSPQSLHPHELEGKSKLIGILRQFLTKLNGFFAWFDEVLWKCWFWDFFLINWQQIFEFGIAIHLDYTKFLSPIGKPSLSFRVQVLAPLTSSISILDIDVCVHISF